MPLKLERLLKLGLGIETKKYILQKLSLVSNTITPDEVLISCRLKFLTELPLWLVYWSYREIPQPAITCSNLTIETLEEGVKCVQS